LIWQAIPPLQDSTHGWAIVPVGVILQEIARAVFIRLYLSASTTGAASTEKGGMQVQSVDLANERIRFECLSSELTRTACVRISLFLLAVAPSAVSVWCRSMRWCFP
jgi:hypothetical protein